MSGTVPRRWVPHPMTILLLTVSPMLGVLAAHKPWFAMSTLICCVLIALARGLRFAAVVVVTGSALFLLLRVGMGLWLPSEFATSGALRIVALSVLLIVPLAFVNWPILADTFITRFHVPYRVMDTVLLGERFSTLMHSDLRVAVGMARVRSRGAIVLQMTLMLRATLTILIASFRHADELAIAMDARGFGAYPTRTVHNSRSFRLYDLVLLGSTSIANATIVVVLESV